MQHCKSKHNLGCTSACKHDREVAFIIKSNGERPRAWPDHMRAKFAPAHPFLNPDCVDFGMTSVTVYRDLFRSNPAMVVEILTDVEAQNKSGMALKLHVEYVEQPDPYIGNQAVLGYN